MNGKQSNVKLKKRERANSNPHNNQKPYLGTIQSCCNEDIKVLIGGESILVLFNITWCHFAPAETPTSRCSVAIRVEEDLHSVAPSRYDWRQEVIGLRWRI